MNTVISHEPFSQVKSWILTTKDAHGFYKKFGFENALYPERIMIKKQ